MKKRNINKILLFVFFLTLTVNGTLNSNNTPNRKGFHKDSTRIKSDPKLAESGGYGVEWYRTYGNALVDDHCVDMAMSSSEDLYLIGNTDIVKYNKFGSHQWTREWYISGDDDGNAVTVDSSGNIYIAGEANNEMCLVKYSSSGTHQWSRTISISNIDEAFAVAVDASNYIYIAGESYTSGTWPLRDFVLVKYSSSGSHQWTRTLDLSEEDTCTAITTDSSNNIYLGGTSRYGYGGDIYFTVAKYTSSGSLQWSRTWNTGSAMVKCGGIDLDTSNNIYLGGGVYVSSTYQTILTKFSSSGSYIWNRKWGGSGWEIAYDIAIDANNNIYLGGYTTSYGAGLYDFCFLVYTSNGALQTYETWGGTQYDYGRGIAVSADKNVYLAGHSLSYGPGKYDMCLVKFNPAPQITINSPSPDQVFGTIAPGFDVSILDLDLIERYYQLNGGTSYPFSGSTGIIDQNAWNSCDDGPVNITFYGRDPGGVVYEQVTVYKDTTGPNITILSPKIHEICGNKTIRFELSIENNDHEAIWYTVNGSQTFIAPGKEGIINENAWNACGNGSVNICFYANDSLNNIGYKNITVEKDLYYPFIEIISPIPDQLCGISAPQYNISISTLSANTTWYTLNNSQKYFINEMSGKLNQTAWNECTSEIIVIKFFVNNSVSVENYEEVFIRKDTAIPNITIITPASFQIVGNRTFEFDLSISNTDFTQIWYSINGSENYTASGLNDIINRTLWESFDNGTILITFYAKNSAGNIGSKNITLLKDLKHLYEKKLYAIIVGIEDYPGTINDLNYCKEDALSIRNFLNIKYNVKSSNIITLFDSSATLNSISNAFNTVSAKIYPEDIFFFYYSGHGGSSSSQYLCPYDSLPSNPSKLLYDTNLDSLLDTLSSSQNFVIIDACNSGGMIAESSASGRFFITACDVLEYSIETHYLHHGVFTHFFLESFDNALDIHEDEIVSMEEQYGYTGYNTWEYAMDLGANQNPRMYDGISGQAIFYPAIGPITASINGNQLAYSCMIYGNGKIEELNLTICSVDSTIVIETIDLLKYSTSADGFGYYTGMAELSIGETISSYEIAMKISGYQEKVLRRTYGDFDDDGLFDLFEIRYGLNPQNNDTDGDYITDGWEYDNGLNPFTMDSQEDPDNDDLSNIEEFHYNTNPHNNDTENDGMPDGWEIEYNLNPNYDDSFEDPDIDYLSNIEEFHYNTYPNDPDSDNDGILDGEEIEQGTNPLDPNDPPKEESGGESGNDSGIRIGFNIFIIIGLISVISIVIYVVIKKFKPKPTVNKLKPEPFIVKDQKKVISRIPQKSDSIKFCPYCRALCNSQNKFCTSCGRKLLI